MKNLKPLFTSLLLLCVFSLYAQKDYQAYWVHVDEVNPDKLYDYEKVATDFANACKTHKVEGADYITIRSSELEYVTVAPINNMADLDKNPLAGLREKMGKEAFGKMFDRFDECYDVHYDLIVWHSKKHSYTPGEDYNPQDENYRQYVYYYYAPSKGGEMAKIAKEFKELYTSLNLKSYYNIYFSGFGARENYIMVSWAAKDALDLEKKMSDAQKIIGDKNKDLIKRLLQTTSRIESKRANVRSDLSYVSSK